VIRFLADENVSRLVVERLRAAGFDVASVRETRPGAPDKDVLDEADSDDRVLVTEDRDFGELVVRQRLKVRGVILLELDRLTSAAEAELVAEIVRIHASKLTGNLLVIEPARVRIRPLPR
jgi:predicted nuclease of predicted toxin-antitoxin system